MATERSENYSTIVVGAGVIGCAIAFRLARQGENVLLIDRKEPGMEASWGNAGHVAIEQIFPLASPSTVIDAPGLLLRHEGPLSIRPGYALQIMPWLTRFAWASRPDAFERGTAALQVLQSSAMDSFANLCAEAGIANLLHRRGHMILVEKTTSVRAAKKDLATLQKHGIDGEWLDADHVAQLAPDLRRDVAGAVLLKHTGHVSDPYKICDGLFQAHLDAGGSFLQDEVRRLNCKPGEACEVMLDSGSVSADRIVVSAGAWSARLVRQLGYSVPLDTERGYNVTAEGWNGEFDIAIASHERMTIMTPLDRGLRITGFVELGGLDLPPVQARLETLKKHLRELLPDADMPELSEWMGFRPSLPDHLPMIGVSPKNENVFFAFGHQHLGLTLAGITADIIATLARSEESPVDLDPYRVDRFC